MTALDVIIGQDYVALVGEGIKGGLKIVRAVGRAKGGDLIVLVRTYPGRIMFAPGARRVGAGAFRRQATPRETAVGLPILPVAHPEVA